MNICFVVNKNYIGQLKVCMKSLFETNKNHIDIFLLQNDLDDADKDDLSKFINKYNQSINYITMDDSNFIGLPKMGYDSSYTAYFKIMIPYILNYLDRVLYLDCDILVEKDLTSLYNRVTTNFLSSCLDERMNKKKQNHVEKIVGYKTNKYFNSGVVLFDFKHSDQIVNKENVFAYIKANLDIIEFHDQDILNHFYVEHNDVIDRLYNYLTIYNNVKEIFIDKNINNAFIIHYANWKPWNNNYIGKHYKAYYKMYKSIEKQEKLNYLKKRNIFSMTKLICKYLFRK